MGHVQVFLEIKNYHILLKFISGAMRWLGGWDVDKISCFVFPLVFTLFNICYWVHFRSC